MLIRWLSLISVAGLLGACATTPTTISPMIGPYVEPRIDSGEVAMIEGQIVDEGILLGKSRSRVVGIDAHEVDFAHAISGPLPLLAGKHSIAVICESQRGEIATLSTMSLEALPAHKYSLHCETKGPVFNTGEKFSILDKSNHDEVVSTSEGWAPNTGMHGKIF